MFSPYYAWSGRRDPLDHVAMNVALWGPGRWAMTERGRGALERTGDSLRIGPSGLRDVGGELHVDIDELGCPVPRRLRGRVRLVPEVRCDAHAVLASDGDHRWWPIAPRARVEVAFDKPALRWSGIGYLDCNWGAEPLEAGFRSWTWSRAPLQRGAAVLYDLLPRRGPSWTMALRIGADGVPEEMEAPPPVALPRTRFRLPRTTRSDGEARVVDTVTDSHFYARSVIEAELFGERVAGVHEALSLERFATRWAKWLLPFRMPRRG